MDEEDEATDDAEDRIADISDLFDSPTLTQEEVEHQLESEGDVNDRLKEIRSFLNKKGAIELLCIARRHRFSDLETKLDLSPPTLTKRLNEAKRLDLLTDFRAEKEDEAVTLYTIDELARPFISHMRSIGILQTVERYIEVKTTLEEKKSGFQNFISDDGRLLNLALKNQDEIVEEVKQNYEQSEEDSDSN